jgi:hypothetical protein
MGVQALRKFTAPGGIVRRYWFARIANASALVTLQHGVEISSGIAAWAGTRDTLPGRKISSKGGFAKMTDRYAGRQYRTTLQACFGHR